MILKFLSKYILEVIPSILATVVGAYIVTHYINARPDTDKAKTEASAPAATPAPAAPVRAAGQDSRKESPKAALVPDDRAQILEKTALEKSPDSATAVRQPVMKDFLKRKTVVKASPDPAPAETTAATPPDDRDANDLARAAIERLRNADQAKDLSKESLKDKDAAKSVEKPVDVPRIQDAMRTPEPVRAPEPTHPPQDRARSNAAYAPAPVVAAPVASVTAVPAPAAPAQTAAVPALPPATVVAPTQISPPPHVVRADDPSRPTPPADIPARPIDLRAAQNTQQDRGSVADDVVAAAKTMFKSVLPDTR